MRNRNLFSRKDSRLIGKVAFNNVFFMVDMMSTGKKPLEFSKSTLIALLKFTR